MKNFTILPDVKRINFWLAVWMLLAVSYIIPMKYDFHIKVWDYLFYFAHLVADVCMSLLSYLAYRNRVDATSKKFYLLIFIGLFPALFANEIYSFFVNIIGIKRITNNISTCWTMSYIFFLVTQISAWLYLLGTNRKEKMLARKAWFLRLTYVQPAIIVLLALISMILVGNSVLSRINKIGLGISILETALFILLSVCLSKTKNKSLAYLEAGFLLAISFNLMHRFTSATEYYFKGFYVLWLVCLIIIIFGFLFSYKNRNEKVEFFELNSIHVLTGEIFTLLTTFLLTFSVLTAVFISSIGQNSVGVSNVLLQNIPNMLIFSYTLSFLLSKSVANYLSKPLENISKKIDENNFHTSFADERKFRVFEIDKLEKFIFKTITQLQVANRVKSDFLMNMSHDFRTPASGIYHVARSVHKRVDDPKSKKLLQLVIDSSEQLIKTLDDVLDFSRLDSGEFKLNIQELNVKSILEEVTLLVSAKAEEKMLDLKTDFLSEDSNLFGDKLLVHRILLNLVSNAIKFTHVGGVSIAADKEKEGDNEWLVVKVKDTGIGIDKDYHKAIFESFVRVESSETGKYPGVGLGLSNVRLMLKQMGGKITVDSCLGEGALFSVYFPIK